MSRSATTIFIWVSYLVVAAVLGWAGTVKALDPSAFATSIMGFRIVPWPVAAGLALYLPWLELFVAAGVLVPRWRGGALVLATALFAAFAVIWAATWWRGIDVACGCFGGAGRTPAGWALARVTAVALLSGWLLKRKLRDDVNAP